MATASKRLTRKDLRQPDWFQVTVDKGIKFYEANRIWVILGAGALFVLLLTLWGWQAFKERQDVAAAQEFAHAMTLYRAEKYREAVKAFETVQSYRWSSYSALAYLYQANSYLATQELDKALTMAQRFASQAPANSLYRQIGLITLASIKERKSQCKEAIDHYGEAEKILAPLRDRAILGRARCYEQIGDLKAAILAYKEYLRDQPSSSLPLKIAELEAAVTSGKSSK